MTAELTNHKGPQHLGPVLVSNVGMRADDYGAITSHGVRLGWSIAIAALLTLYAAPGIRDPEPHGFAIPGFPIPRFADSRLGIDDR